MFDINLSKNDIMSRIQHFKKIRKMSSYEISLQLGHSVNYFYRIENGEIQLTLDLLLNILDILQVSTAEFFYPSLGSYGKDMQLLQKLDKLSEEEKRSLLTILKIN